LKKQTASLNRRRMLTLIASGLLGAAVSACGMPMAPGQATPLPQGQAADQPGARPTAAPAPPTVADTRIQLRFAHWNSEMRPVIEAFEQANPEVRVNFIPDSPDGILRSFRSGLGRDAPIADVCSFGLSGIGALADREEIQDLNASPFDAAALEPDVIKQCWDIGRKDGRQFAIPWLAYPGALCYRASLLEAAGFDSDPVALQQQLQTWDDLIGLGSALRAKSPAVALIPDPADLFWAGVAQAGPGWLDGNKVLIEEKGVRSAQLAARALEEKIDAGLQQGGSPIGEIKQDQLAAVMVSAGIERFLLAELPDQSGQWRIIGLPGGAAVYDIEFLVIPRQSAHLELAWKLLRYLAASPEGQTSLYKLGAGVPVYRPAWQDPFYDQPNPAFGNQQLNRFWIEQASQMPIATISKYESKAQDDVTIALNHILFQQTDPEATILDAESQFLKKNEGLVG
jgi:multiple sugar transport system substrate-binding protein